MVLQATSQELYMSADQQQVAAEAAAFLQSCSLPSIGTQQYKDKHMSANSDGIANPAMNAVKGYKHCRSNCVHQIMHSFSNRIGQATRHQLPVLIIKLTAEIGDSNSAE